MPLADRRLIRDVAWLVIVFILSSAWCFTASRRIGATFDEPIYLQAGLDVWRTGSHYGLLRLGTMPLPADVQTLPLYLIERWRGQPWNLETESDAALHIARTTNLLFWGLLLVYGWRAGRLIAEPWGGKLAVAVLACEPNLLAHAALATTDVAVSACLLAFLVQYRLGRDGPALNRIVIPGVWYGIALTAKASALVFGPLCMLAIEAHRQLSLSQRLVPTYAELRAYIRESFQIGCLGLLVTFIICGCDWQVQVSFVDWAQQLPDGSAKTAMVWFAEHLCLFSNAGEGLVRQIKHNMHGHGMYLLGAARDHSIWYYFPVLFTIKLAVPFLLAPILLLALRARSLLNWATVSAFILFLFSINCRVQIGIRLELPFIVLAVVGLSAAVVNAVQSLDGSWRAPILRFGAVAGVAWMAIDCVSVWPDGLRFINEFWGGRRDGYLLVSDSNYDWGQGLPELSRWQQRNGIDDLAVWYFGTDPTIRRPGMHELPLHTLPAESLDVARLVAGRRVAVGTTLLYGHGLTESQQIASAYLLTCKPVARTSTFLVFDFTNSSSAVARGEHQP